MAKYRQGRQSFILPTPPVITAWASTAGKKESEGPLSHSFDVTIQTAYLGTGGKTDAAHHPGKTG